jgi:lysylphosphatidylglycerol synthetase-like protein (DUF2156 family)
MNPRALAAIGTVLSVVLKAHLSVAAAGLVISVSLPWFILIALVLASAAVLWLIVRSARGFRSSPFPRAVS